MHVRTLDGRVPGGLLSVKPGLEEVRLQVLVGPKVVSHSPRTLIIVLRAPLAWTRVMTRDAYIESEVRLGLGLSPELQKLESVVGGDRLHHPSVTQQHFLKTELRCSWSFWPCFRQDRE
jgi:hypothetical protein